MKRSRAKNRKLATRIVLLYAGSMFILFIALGLAVRGAARDSVIPVASDLAAEVVAARAEAIDQLFEGHIRTVATFAQRDLIRGANLDAIATDLRARADDLPSIYEMMFFALRDGRFVTTSGDTGSVATRDYFQHIVAHGNRFVVSNAIVSLASGEAVVTVAHEVRAPNGEVVGVGAATLLLETLSAIAGNVRVGEAGYGWLVDATGTVVAHPRSDLRMSLTVTEADESGFTGLSELGARMRHESNGIGRYRTPEGEERAAFFAAIEAAPGWTFVVDIPAQQLTAAADRVVGSLTMIVAAIFIVVVVISLLVARIIARPIRESSALLSDISEGQGDLTRSLPVRSDDELGRLAGGFNRFLEQLSGIVRTIRQSVQTLETVGQSLAVNMEQTSAAVNQISANIDGVKQQVINQSASVTEVSSTMEEIARNIESLNNKIGSQAAGVIQSSSAIEEMVASIQSVSNTLKTSAGYFQQLLDAADTGRTRISGTTSLVRDIAQKSDGLLDANAAIQTIASQTNLLAMNAAIEAAHAGDYGRGFAVVADEIRKLAEGAAAQSKSISAVLKSIKNSIDSVAESSVEAEGAFEHVSELIGTLADLERQIQNAMEEQSAGSTQLLKALEEINQVTQEVQSGSGEMNEGSRIILEEMQRLVDITHEVESSMNEMADGTAEINRVVVNVAEMGDKNREGIRAVLDAVGRFKLKEDQRETDREE